MFFSSTVPTVEWQTRVDNEWQTLKSEDVFSGKRVVLFALPGAFTPTCSNFQLPGFDLRYNEFIENGIDEVYCLSVNDSFVMNAWFESLDIKNVKAIPDGSVAFTNRLGMSVAKDHVTFGLRSWRYAMVVNDGEIEQGFIEKGFGHNTADDPYEISTPENVLAFLRGDDFITGNDEATVEPEGKHIELVLDDSADIKERFGS